MNSYLRNFAVLTTAATLAACSSFGSKKETTVEPVNPAPKVQAQVQLPSHINPYEQLMLGKTWVTVAAIDQDKKQIPATDKRVSNYFGFAQYGVNGQFAMYTPDQKPKMQGDWSFSEDGKQRVLVAKDATGKVLFERKVENVGLNADLYVYRIYPNAKNKKKYIDIYHQTVESLQRAQAAQAQKPQ